MAKSIDICITSGILGCMDSNVTGFSVVEQIAKRLEADIRNRGLCEGMRYLSTVEAGHMLGVSPATAHRAMQLLVERRLVVRRMKSGTFVGPSASPKPRHGIEAVHVLTTPEKRQYASTYASSFLEGLGQAIPHVNVQFTFVPPHDSVGFLKDLLDAEASADKVFGFVASSCPREVYQLLAERGVPTVVSGTLPLDGPDLPSVALDDFEGGRLLTEYVLGRGHRRIVLLATTLDRPGDKLLFDGISDPLSRAGLPHNSLVFQVVEETPSSVGAAVHHFLEMPDRPTAFIARNERLADKTAKALSQNGFRVGDDVEVVFVDHATEVVEQSPHPHVQSKWSRVEGARLMGEILSQLHEGKSFKDWRTVIPVEFRGGKRREEEPGDHGSHNV